MTYSSNNRKGRKHWYIAGIVLFAVLLLAGGGALFGARLWYQRQLGPVSSDNKLVEFEVKQGAVAQEIAQELEKRGLIQNAAAFEWYVRTEGLRDKLQAGTYNLRPSQSVQDIADEIASGKVSTTLITVLPAQRLDQIQKAFEEAGFSKEEVSAALSPAGYRANAALTDKPLGASLEGYLYPESFQLTASTKATDIIKLSLEEMAKRLTPERRAAFARHGLSVHQAIILASIVEQEVSNVDDRKVVAQVFYRRLQEGMQLGSDVTYFYAAAITGQTPSPSLDSPYNTRKYDGLPPGPISNVSESSLDAVANPASTDYLYFVAGDDGKTYFSHTQAEHEALTREHCTTLCQ